MQRRQIIAFGFLLLLLMGLKKSQKELSISPEQDTRFTGFSSQVNYTGEERCKN